MNKACSCNRPMDCCRGDEGMNSAAAGSFGEDNRLPLLAHSHSTGREGTASSAQTLANIVVSILGTGILGLPYAFKIAGWLAGSIGTILAGISTYYCMLLLVQCKERVERDHEVRNYGDLGEIALGRKGRILTESIVLISQSGCCVAFLVFIAENLLSVLDACPAASGSLSLSSLIFLLVPVEIALSWIRSLSSMAPFSILADICNALAVAIVVKDELPLVGTSRREPIRGAGGLTYAAGVAVFCFEGFCMTLPLQSSMRERERHRFPLILALAFAGIAAVYVCFGLSGFLAYGDETRDIITLNLPSGDWSTIVVKVGLCIGLTLTFPMMMHPVHEIVEGRLCCGGGSYGHRLYALRGLLVVAIAAVASFAPGFGAMISLLGSTFCGLLSFVLPALFHLLLMPSTTTFANLWERSLDVLILVLGAAFAGYGTYLAAQNA